MTIPNCTALSICFNEGMKTIGQTALSEGAKKCLYGTLPGAIEIALTIFQGFITLASLKTLPHFTLLDNKNFFTASVLFACVLLNIISISFSNFSFPSDVHSHEKELIAGMNASFNTRVICNSQGTFSGLDSMGKDMISGFASNITQDISSGLVGLIGILFTSIFLGKVLYTGIKEPSHRVYLFSAAALNLIVLGFNMALIVVSATCKTTFTTYQEKWSLCVKQN